MQELTRSVPPCAGCQTPLLGPVRYCPYCGGDPATGRGTVVASSGGGETSDAPMGQTPATVSVAVTVRPEALPEAQDSTAEPPVSTEPVAVPPAPGALTPTIQPRTQKRWVGVGLLVGVGVGLRVLLWGNVRPRERTPVGSLPEAAKPSSQSGSPGRNRPSPPREALPASPDASTARPERAIGEPPQSGTLVTGPLASRPPEVPGLPERPGPAPDRRPSRRSRP